MVGFYPAPTKYVTDSINIGLVGMQINLLDSGTFFFISDHCHVIENVCLITRRSLKFSAPS